MAKVTFESFITDYNIEIPAIQRDYVQGRGFTIEEQDKREAFVTKLINAITNDNIKPCHLEFIYGTVNNNSHSFIPLDGQQRLTTLFILHWVVWNLSTDDAKKKYPIDMISGFRYVTRLSSLSFCKNIIAKDLLPLKVEDKLGNIVMQQPWFSDDWHYDPTIMAMISMINLMEEKLKFYNKEQISDILAKLCSKDNAISFNVLNMTDYDLTDSLYIKMNARGKHLTPFENWKSDFIKFLESEFGEEEYIKSDKTRKTPSFSYKDYFCYSIEHQWTDLFWNYIIEDYLKLDEEQQQKQYPCIDKMFMNFFDFICMYFYYTQGEVNTDYAKVNASIKRNVWQQKKFVDFLFGALDSLCKIDHSLFFNELFYTTNKELDLDNQERKVRLFRTEQCNLFRLCVNYGSSMELTDLLLFYALLYYCTKNDVCDVDETLKSYMRSVRNYFESEIQNLRTRTTVQLNLRVSEFNKYDSSIKKFADTKNSVLSIADCMIDDCLISRGNTEVFKKSIENYGNEKVVDALSAFCNASTSERVRVLIACGFTGTYLSDCIGRKRNFFGNQDKWDVLFISDKEQLSNCFAIYTSKIMEGKSNHTIILDALHECSSYGYAYYMLKYDSFLNANNSQHHFAVKGDIDTVDWTALGSYSSNPGTAYHADPLAVAVEKELLKKGYKINLSLYKQYSGKPSLSIVKDKKHWEELFSVKSRGDGWHITKGFELLTENIKSKFSIQENKQEFVILKEEERDMVQICVDLMIEISTLIKY